MELINTFVVSLPIEETWETFLDLERIAPCLPGAAITDVDGENFHGGVKIKVGPVSVKYEGVATFVEKDRSTHTAVLDARGRDVGGQGNANAVITARLESQAGGTKVVVRTDLDLSGRVAQFGRGVVGDVASKILGQFAKNLEAEINSGKIGGDAPKEAPKRPASLDDVEAMNAMGTLGPVLAKYVAPAAGVLAALVVVGSLISRRSRGSAGGYRSAGLAGAVPINIFLNLPPSAQPWREIVRAATEDAR
ncbi:MAG: hypothetical protein JWR27_2706 [Aeromicrobium sp.]|nr:hypothetical protein [Aeromicrobium sp.]